jgi:amino acid transporter
MPRTPTTPGSTDQADRDARQLAELGYTQELDRSFSLWNTFAVGFTFISPVVGIYSIIAFGMMTAGPAWLWTLPAVLAGQVLVALIFAELASQFPISGGIYQWARRLVGPTYAWFVGWGYLWTVMLTVTAICFFGGGFLAALFGSTPDSNTESVLWALVVLAACTAANIVGLNLLRLIVNAGIGAELVASVITSVLLLLFFREHSVSSLFDSLGTAAAFDGDYAWAFWASMAFTGWAFVGFDACGTISEETRNPTRQVPRAILFSLLSVATVIILSAAAVELAVPSQEAVVSGDVVDPVITAFTAAFGGGLVEKGFLAVVVVAYVACGIAVQATATRIAFSFARDRMLPGSGLIRRVSPKSQVPVVATLMTATVSALALFFSKAQQTLIAFGSGGFYICFFLICAAALYARVTGRWTPAGPFSLGRLGLPINVLAVVWLFAEGLNIAWPRLEDVPWYQDWAIPFIALCLVVSGILYVTLARPQDRRSEALGD